MSHVPRVNEPWLSHTSQMPRTLESLLLLPISLIHVPHMKESCPTCDWVTTYYTWRSHVPHVNESYLLYISHGPKTHRSLSTPPARGSVFFLNEVCPIFVWVWSHIYVISHELKDLCFSCPWVWMSHAPHINEACPACKSVKSKKRKMYHTLSWSTSIHVCHVILNTNESCPYMFVMWIHVMYVYMNYACTYESCLYVWVMSRELADLYSPCPWDYFVLLCMSHVHIQIINIRECPSPPHSQRHRPDQQSWNSWSKSCSLSLSLSRSLPISYPLPFSTPLPHTYTHADFQNQTCCREAARCTTLTHPSLQTHMTHPPPPPPSTHNPDKTLRHVMDWKWEL